VPPAIIFIQGGTLAKDMSDQLKLYLSGQTKARNRAVVVEAQSSSGSLDSAGAVQVRVERFGSEKMNDAMFQNYDKNTAEHVRIGFRIPELFLGVSKELNFATAMTAYMVAEAQVFQPERAEFDTIINKTLMKSMGFKTLKFRSNPITLKNIDAQLKAMQLVSQIVDPEELVDEVNKIAGVTLTYLPGTQIQAVVPGAQPGEIQPVQAKAKGKPGKKEVEEGADQLETSNVNPNQIDSGDVISKLDTHELISLSMRYAQAEGLTVMKSEISEHERAQIKSQVKKLKGEQYRQFVDLLGAYTFGPTAHGMRDVVDGCLKHGHGP